MTEPLLESMPHSMPQAAGPGQTRVRSLLVAALIGVGVCFLVWLPYAGRLDLFGRHFDGPCYMVVAKTFYRPTTVNPLPGYILHPGYFTIHFPLFPAGIRLFAPLFGYPGGMLAATLLFAAASAAAFRLYADKVLPEVPPLVALLAFLLFPARHTMFRALGSAEGAFVLFLLIAVWAYHEDRLALAFAAAALSAVTRINGLLVIGALSLVLLDRRRFRWAFGGGAAALVPFGTLCLWFWHLFGNPFSFLEVHSSKKTPFPFAEIAEKIREGNWEGAELLAAFVLMMALGAARLWSMKLPLESVLVFSHIALFAMLRESNVVRWASPFAPFFLVVAWRELWREKWISLTLLAGLGVFSIVYSWQSVYQDLVSEPAYQYLLRFLQS